MVFRYCSHTFLLQFFLIKHMRIKLREQRLFYKIAIPNKEVL